MKDIQVQSEETITVKKSTMVLQLHVKRGLKGLLVRIKTDAILEDLFREWSNGQLVAAKDYFNGRSWTGDLPKFHQLTVLPAGGGTIRFSDGFYNLHRVGCPLVEEENGVNLAFLRFEGISSESGVTFTVKGVYSRDEVRRQVKLVEGALVHFYQNFLKPLDLMINMSTTEI